MMTSAQVDESFDYQATAELFPAKTFGEGHVLLNICDLTTRQTLFVSPSNDFRPMFSWELIWKSTKSDTTAVQFVACMTAQNILSAASPKSPEH